MEEALRVRSWIHMYLLSNQLAGFLFRGHREAEWALQPTLERLSGRWGTPRSLIRSSEKQVLFEFRRRAHHFVPDPPKRRDLLEWTALAQHFGAPTRLLDVTRSFFVAAFFAMDNADGEAAVWAFNRGHLISALAEAGHVTEGLPFRRSNRECIKLCHAALASGKLGPGVVPVEPFRLNRRISVQQGAFLLPLDVTQSFEKNLGSTVNADLTKLANPQQVKTFDPFDSSNVNLGRCSVVKIIIPQPIHSHSILELEKMNVNSASLFDGLDGFARSLVRVFRVWDKISPAAQAADRDMLERFARYSQQQTDGART